MATNVNDVRLIAPEFTTLDAAIITSFIAIADKFINTKIWGEKADIGRAYFTAHLLKSRPILPDGGEPGGGVIGPNGPASMEKVGDIQRSFSEGGGGGQAAGGVPRPNATTYYGEIFEQLKRTLLITPIVNS